MEFLDYMPQYFKGEKAIAYYALPIGLALLVLALAVGKFHWSNEVARGLLIPLALLAVAALGTGGFIYQKSEADIKRLTASYQQNPDQTIVEEGARMAQVNANWSKLKIAWAIVMVIALVVIFAVSKPLWLGIALGLLLLGTGGFAVDIFAEQRAAVYAAHLQGTDEETTD